MNAPQELPVLDRTEYLGGTDAASIHGLSKWRTPLQTYLIKTKQEVEVIDAAKAKVFKRGKRLEPIVIDMLAEEYGVEVTKRSTDAAPNRYTDPEHSFLRSEVDFEFRVTQQLLDMFPPGFIDPSLLGTIQNGEIKTVHPLMAHLWGDEFTEEVPIDYAAQSMHGLSVTGRQVCLYAALVGADNLIIYKIDRDAETIAGMRQKMIDFWFNNVLSRVPPDPVNMDDIKTLFAKINGRPVEIDQETLAKVEEVGLLRAQIKMAEAQLDDLQFQVANFIRKAWAISPAFEPEDNAELRFAGRAVATWKKQRGTFLDQKRLKAEYPDTTAKYTVEHMFRVLRLKAKK